VWIHLAEETPHQAFLDFVLISAKFSGNDRGSDHDCKTGHEVRHCGTF
jgi:hypothetical protein